MQATKGRSICGQQRSVCVLSKAEARQNKGAGLAYRDGVARERAMRGGRVGEGPVKKGMVCHPTLCWGRPGTSRVPCEDRVVRHWTGGLTRRRRTVGSQERERERLADDVGAYMGGGSRNSGRVVRARKKGEGAHAAKESRREKGGTVLE